jgi:hypothetical protein
MTARLELRWEFTSTSLCEEASAYQFEHCKIVVGDGVVIAALPLSDGNTKSDLRALSNRISNLCFSERS